MVEKEYIPVYYHLSIYEGAQHMVELRYQIISLIRIDNILSVDDWSIREQDFPSIGGYWLEGMSVIEFACLFFPPCD